MHRYTSQPITQRNTSSTNCIGAQNICVHGCVWHMYASCSQPEPFVFLRFRLRIDFTCAYDNSDTRLRETRLLQRACCVTCVFSVESICWLGARIVFATKCNTPERHVSRGDSSACRRFPCKYAVYESVCRFPSHCGGWMDDAHGLVSWMFGTPLRVAISLSDRQAIR